MQLAQQCSTWHKLSNGDACSVLVSCKRLFASNAGANQQVMAAVHQFRQQLSHLPNHIPAYAVHLIAHIGGLEWSGAAQELS